jgi:hypothetical protein
MDGCCQLFNSAGIAIKSLFSGAMQERERLRVVGRPFYAGSQDRREGALRSSLGAETYLIGPNRSLP